MPGSADPTNAPLPAEDAFLELLIETLQSLDRPARGQFLQRFFRSVAHLELSESQSLEMWEQILARQKELSESTGKAVSLKAAIIEVLASSNWLRVPILMEYEELKKLQINAATDPLTGLYNRRLFEEYFEKELNRAHRYGLQLALVVMDLNRFKEVNDRYGHPKGDQVLQAAASTLRRSLRTSDYAFRIGGDEFALLLPQADAEQVGALCRRVRANFQSASESLRVDVPLGLDYGMAVYPQDGDQKEPLIRVADERLYQLKHTDRARLTEFPLPKPSAAEKPEMKPPAEPTGPVAGAAGAPTPPGRPPTERRKWERVSLSGTRAYAVLAETPEKTAKVLDLGYGGVALETEAPEELSESFHAVLHVPILPPVRVGLRRIYVLRGEGAASRVGCSFVS